MPQIEVNQNTLCKLFHERMLIMDSFEKFHPVLTAHYTLDWLTRTQVKRVDDLFNQPNFTTVSAEKLPNQIFDTVKGINHVMQRVMNTTELTWGITDSNDGSFKGIITISGFNRDDKTGIIDFTFVKNEARELSEVIKRVVEFAKDHFDFTKLEVNLNAPATVISSILKENNFETLDRHHFELDLSTTN
ncbi:N-acetyltransferase [Lentilactobacillus hilgardii]|uniref:N-acetyltransferase n=1 Tax=Lentilactobacillus hilgardii TaxID=1588 RepID=UPI0036F44C5E|nr:N-acetyltransferase [Lentilactobacillus hilgardii]MCP9349160.1 N-acetyltransferase [Lentilactobacillus hilgardii]MCP9352028.1 N-acetyltransferase [Lentilactobacillus hilgardii]